MTPCSTLTATRRTSYDEGYKVLGWGACTSHAMDRGAGYAAGAPRARAVAGECRVRVYAAPDARGSGRSESIPLRGRAQWAE